MICEKLAGAFTLLFEVQCSVQNESLGCVIRRPSGWLFSLYLGTGLTRLTGPAATSTERWAWPRICTKHEVCLWPGQISFLLNHGLLQQQGGDLSALIGETGCFRGVLGAWHLQCAQSSSQQPALAVRGEIGSRSQPVRSPLAVTA